MRADPSSCTFQGPAAIMSTNLRWSKANQTAEPKGQEGAVFTPKWPWQGWECKTLLPRSACRWMSTIIMNCYGAFLSRHIKSSIKREFTLWLSELRTRHRVHEDTGSIPGFARWVKIWHCCKPLCRSPLQLRSGAAVVVGSQPIRSLAWELPYATGAAVKRKI